VCMPMQEDEADGEEDAAEEGDDEPEEKSTSKPPTRKDAGQKSDKAAKASVTVTQSMIAVWKKDAFKVCLEAGS
jgi:hypothetical protein